ncbi:MAG TPA: hypothetical protein VGY55_15765 [Pirellulales bacterium]|jgi:hypothetical protein|nr:hypothetical protein [Pirellulales bacterium]
MTETRSNVAADGPSALRIRFLKQVPGGAVPLSSFAHPYPRFAVAESLSVEELLALPVAPEPAEDQLRLALVPAGLASPLELQKRAEDWMHRGGFSAGQPTAEIMLRSERILWRPGQALLIGPLERLQEVLPGLIEFSFYEGELRKLEREMEADWDTAEVDAYLTHSVDGKALERRAHVDEMTLQVTRRRMRFARLEPCLEKASISLLGPARRLASELAMQAEVIDRLGWLDDRIEVCEDLYELANDRLSEFSYFHREFRLEFWIIVLLVAEVVIMSIDLWLTARGH